MIITVGQAHIKYANDNNVCIMTKLVKAHDNTASHCVLYVTYKFIKELLLYSVM